VIARRQDGRATVTDIRGGAAERPRGRPMLVARRDIPTAGADGVPNDRRTSPRNALSCRAERRYYAPRIP